MNLMLLINKKHLAVPFLALLISGISLATSVRAATSPASLESQLDGLLGKLQDVSTPLSGCSVPAAPLALGSYGPEVKKLQIWLGEHGHRVVPAGKESQYFGPLTHFALIKFQTAAGIRPVSGFYGPITKAEIEKRCAAEEVSQIGLRVVLADNSPKGEVLPYGSARVEVLRLNVTGKSTLNSLTIHRYGSGKTAGFARVYLFDGDVRLTPGYSFDPVNGLVTFENIQLAIAGTKTLSVVADVSKLDGVTTDGVEVLAADAIKATGFVNGTFPIRGGAFARMSDRMGTLAIEKSSAMLLDPLIGQDEAKVAEFVITSRVAEDVSLRSIALASESSFDSSLISNFVLKRDKVTVAVASAVNARGQILLRFHEALLILPDTSNRYELYADLAPTIEPEATLRIYLQAPVDLYATGKTAGKGVSVTSRQYDNSAEDSSDASWLTIKGGIVMYTFRGPSVANYAIGQKDAELMRFDIKTKNNIEIREMRFMLSAAGINASGTLMTAGGLCNAMKANYTDVKLVDATTGAVLTRALNTECVTGDQDVSRTLVFEDRWRLVAGQTQTVKLTADIADFEVSAGETIKATLLAFDREDIQNLDRGNPLNDKEVLPAGNMAGATHRVHANEQVANLANTLASVLSDTPSVNN